LHLDYKNKHTSEHHAKSRGDWPTQLADLVAKKRKKPAKYKSAFGRTNKKCLQ